MKDLRLLLMALMLLGGFTLSAQDAVLVSETEEEEEDALSISGFVDVYFMTSFNDYASVPTSFTNTHNSFELGMANVVFAKDFDKVGFVADLAFGPRANDANGTGGFTTDIIKQLFVTYSPTDAITLTAGNFGTHVGYELIDAPGNFNYSTSYMFSNGPFFHTGIKADVALGDKFGAMVGLFNDTDSKSDFLSVPGKQVGAQLSYSDDKLGVYLNYLGGTEDTSGVIVKGNQIDLTATYQATDDFLVGVNATNKAISAEGFENVNWNGAALYLNYSISDAFALGARAEYFNTGEPLVVPTDDNLTVTAFTLSANLTQGALTFIPELRFDIGSEDIFFDSDNNATTTSAALILGAYYAF
ncbi:MAG: outer membrane beta-barrel protein [Saprospiraceae bacterium]